MHALSVNNGIRTRKINIFEDTGCTLGSCSKSIGFEPILIDDDHLTRLDIAHELRTHDIQRTAL